MFDKLVGVAAPFECLVCGREGKPVCNNCLPNIVEPKRSTCFLCNKLTQDWRTCPSCRRKTKLTGAIVASHYQGQIKTLIRMLKYERAQATASILAAVLVPLVPAAQFDLVTWSPASSWRMRQRGYNQAALIAKALGKPLKLPVRGTLHKIGHTRQVGAERRLRLTQVKGTLYVKKAAKLTGLRILMVDDVITTGATMSECADVLKAAGAKRVWGAAIAKH